MKLAVITGSTREGRISNHLAEAIAKRAAEMDGVDVTAIDLRDYDLPMFDEPIPPRGNSNREVTGALKQWLDVLGSADAYVVVSPEYNKGIPGVLKNAFDHVATQFDGKPFALASHGASSGAYAILQLRLIVPQLGGVTIPSFIGLPYGPYDSDGNFTGDADRLEGQIDGLLEQLQQYSSALESLRK